MQQGVALEPGPAELRLSRQPDRARLGDRARPDRGAPAVPRGHRRPLRPLPAAPDPHRARASELPQPPRLLALVRRASSASSRSPAPGASGAARPPSLADVALAGGRAARRSPRSPALGWLVARDRLLPRRPVRAGRTARRAHGGAPRARRRRARSSSRRTRSRSSSSCRRCTSGSGCRRCARSPLLGARVVAARRLRGPGTPLWSFAGRYGLGWDAPWYVVSLFARRLCAAAALRDRARLGRGGGQLVALAAGRYAPYPSAAERPPRGPLRQTVRSIVLAQRRRRRASEPAPRALHG